MNQKKSKESIEELGLKAKKAAILLADTSNNKKNVALKI